MLALLAELGSQHSWEFYRVAGPSHRGLLSSLRDCLAPQLVMEIFQPVPSH